MDFFDRPVHISVAHADAVHFGNDQRGKNRTRVRPLWPTQFAPRHQPHESPRFLDPGEFFKGIVQQHFHQYIGGSTCRAFVAVKCVRPGLRKNKRKNMDPGILLNGKLSASRSVSLPPLLFCQVLSNLRHTLLSYFGLYGDPKRFWDILVIVGVQLLPSRNNRSCPDGWVQ